MTEHAHSSTASEPPRSESELSFMIDSVQNRADAQELAKYLWPRIVGAAQGSEDSGEAAQRLRARKSASFDIASDIGLLLDAYISTPSVEPLRRSDAETALRCALWANKAGIVSLLAAFAKEPCGIAYPPQQRALELLEEAPAAALRALVIEECAVVVDRHYQPGYTCILHAATAVRALAHPSTQSKTAAIDVGSYIDEHGDDGR